MLIHFRNSIVLVTIYDKFIKGITITLQMHSYKLFNIKSKFNKKLKSTRYWFILRYSFIKSEGHIEKKMKNVSLGIIFIEVKNSWNNLCRFLI